MDSRSNIKLVASVEGETSAPQAGPPRKRSNRNNTNWLPNQSFEQLLDAPARYILGRSRPTTPFDSAASHAGCRKGMACRLPQVRRLRLMHRLLVLHRLHRCRLATTAASTTTTLIKTKHSLSSPVKVMTSIACAKDGASRADHPAVMPNPGSYVLVLDPTFASKRLTCQFSRVLVDGGSNINILYLDTLLKLGLKETDVLPTVDVHLFLT
ncbi:hypothetical protein D1007_22867 [Hordeum vulgare]|nr:hypothetical protein D1007_22867 [Hordeum vulgare]